MLGIHEAAAAGALAGLAALDHAARSERLCRIWGIGPWSCDMLAIFYCRDLDVWPEGDLAVQRVFRSYIGRRKPAKAAAAFAPYRSVLALYMWRLAGGLAETERGGPAAAPSPPPAIEATAPSRRASARSSPSCSISESTRSPPPHR